MRKVFVLVIVGVLLGMTYALNAQEVVTIYDIQYTTDPSGTSPYSGQTVTTYGIVTGVFGNSFFIEEKPGGAWHGVYVYRTVSTPSVAVGDSVEVTGLVQEYNNCTEIKVTTESGVVVIANGVALPGTTVVTISEYKQEAYEGVLLRINTVHFLESGTFSSYLYHILNPDETDTGYVYIKSQTNIPGTPIPTGNCDIVGNGYQWYSTYELYPRSTDDIISYENLPPAITYVFRSPYTPSSSQDVEIEALIQDQDGYIILDRLNYSVDGGVSWTAVTHSEVSDSLYYYTIPAQENGTVVIYYLYVEDNLGAPSVSDTFAYVVADNVPQIKINEVLYDAYNQTEPYAEWIELYNAGETTVDLSGWYISDDPNPLSPSGAGDGSFQIPAGTQLDPGEFLILAHTADTFNFYWPDHGSAQVIEYGTSTIAIGNAGDDIHLFTPDLIPVDVMWYGYGGDLMHMGHAAPDVYAGHSLMRQPDGQDTDVPDVDFVDSDETGPTPGTTNTPVTYTCGDVNGDGSVTADDFVYLGNYIFFGGPEPVSMWAADVNGDGTVTADDFVYLGNYLFFGGPEPSCP